MLPPSIVPLSLVTSCGLEVAGAQMLASLGTEEIARCLLSLYLTASASSIGLCKITQVLGPNARLGIIFSYCLKIDTFNNKRAALK